MHSSRLQRCYPVQNFRLLFPWMAVTTRSQFMQCVLKMCFWETLENLKAAGASSLLVLPVEKMLA